MTKNGRFKTFLQKIFLSGIVCSFFLLSTGVFQYSTLQSEAFAQTISFMGVEKVIQPAFLDKFNQGTEKVKIIVLLKGYKAFKGLSIADDTVSMMTVQSTIRSRQERVLTSLDPKQFQLRHRFKNILGFSGEATLQAIQDLARMDEVALIEEDKKVFINTSEGIPLIRADGLHSMGVYGSGVSIAIVDTGVDYTHPELGGGGFPNTKVIGGNNFGDILSSDPMDCQGHGTACAGVAAGDGGGGYFGGVAPSAKIYALKIVAACEGSASFSNMAAAWDWCVSHKNDDPSNPIMIISTSFGGDYLTSSCDVTYPTLATAATNAVANGITVFCSSGNDGFCDGIGAPACVTDAISVGAVYDTAFGDYFPCIDGRSCATKTATTGCETGWYAIDSTAADLVTSYSNSASFLDILAAANCATTTDIVGSGGYDSGNYDSCFGGTSAACPYAAGAGALLQNYAKSQTGSFVTPAQLKSALVTYGDPVTDPKNSLTKPRVNTLASIAGIGGGPVSTSTSTGITTSTPTTVTSTTTSTPSGGCPPSDYPDYIIDCGNGWCCPWYYPFCGYGEDEGWCFPCPADIALRNDETKMAVLRKMRDDRMAGTALGSSLIDLYYEHAEEISEVLLANESLRMMTANVLDRIIEKAVALNNEKEVSIDQGLVNSILEVADAIDKEASPGLKIAIKKVKKEIRKGTIFRQLGVKAAENSR